MASRGLLFMYVLVQATRGMRVENANGDHESSKRETVVRANSTKDRQQGAMSVAKDIYDTLTFLQELPLVQGAQTIYYAHDAFYVEPKAILDKANAQEEIRRQLVLGDLSTVGFAHEVVLHETEEILDALDFSQSSEAFHNAFSREMHVLRKALDEDQPPRGEVECRERFAHAEAALITELCDAACESVAGSGEEHNCSTALLQGNSHGRRAVPDLIDVLEGLCVPMPELVYWSKWPSMVEEAVEVLKSSLAEKFVSPAVMTLSAQVALLQTMDMMVESCAKGSGWRNPLGKAAHAVRRFWRGREQEPVTAKHVVLTKSEQVREYINTVTCPALQAAGCRAGCEGFCATSAEEAAEDAAPHKRAYCGQMREFVEAMKPICEDVGGVMKNIPSLVVNFVGDLTSLYGLAGLSALLVLWNDPSMLLDMNTMWMAIGAVDSVVWLYRRLADGWQDGSDACNDIARQLLKATPADSDSGSLLALGDGAQRRQQHSAAARRHVCDATPARRGAAS